MTIRWSLHYALLLLVAAAGREGVLRELGAGRRRGCLRALSLGLEVFQEADGEGQRAAGSYGGMGMVAEAKEKNSRGIPFSIEPSPDS